MTLASTFLRAATLLLLTVPISLGIQDFAPGARRREWARMGSSESSARFAAWLRARSRERPPRLRDEARG